MKRVVFAVVVGVALWFGLTPFNFFAANDVSWDRQAKALSFNKAFLRDANPLKGVAYVNGAIPLPVGGGFSILVDLRNTATDGSLGYIVGYEDERDRTIFSVAQWKGGLEFKRSKRRAVRNRHDFQYYGAGDFFGKDTFSTALIAFGPGGVSIYVDGRRVSRRSDARLLEAVDVRTGRLSIGNGSEGRKPFTGELRSLAIFAGELDPRSIAGVKPALAYDFSVPPVNGRYESAGSFRNRLTIPSRFETRRSQFLRSPWYSNDDESWDWRDMSLNFLGFIPIGFLLSWSFARYRGSVIKAAMMAAFFCFALSLSIESLQCFLPTRFSSGMDLLLNALGGLLGAFVWLLLARGRRRRNRFELYVKKRA